MVADEKVKTNRHLPRPQRPGPDMKSVWAIGRVAERIRGKEELQDCGWEIESIVVTMHVFADKHLPKRTDTHIHTHT
jgi:hypothetical protein